MRTRRKFLFDCSTVVAGFALVPANFFALSALGGTAPAPALPFCHDTFAALVNTVFRVRLESGQTAELELIKVRSDQTTRLSAGRRGAADVGNEKFSLIFSGPTATILASAIHQFEHDHLGRFAMHISEVGQRAPDDARYQAVFNRPVEPFRPIN